jgi:hypothetical protein
MRSFWRDKDGFTKEDFEKLVTGILFTLSVLVVLYVYVMKMDVNRDIVYLCTALGGLFVIRKGLSYNFDSKYKMSDPPNDDPISKNEDINTPNIPCGKTILSGK